MWKNSLSLFLFLMFCLVRAKVHLRQCSKMDSQSPTHLLQRHTDCLGLDSTAAHFTSPFHVLACDCVLWDLTDRRTDWLSGEWQVFPENMAHDVNASEACRPVDRQRDSSCLSLSPLISHWERPPNMTAMQAALTEKPVPWHLCFLSYWRGRERERGKRINLQAAGYILMTDMMCAFWIDLPIWTWINLRNAVFAV